MATLESFARSSTPTTRPPPPAAAPEQAVLPVRWRRRRLPTDTDRSRWTFSISCRTKPAIRGLQRGLVRMPSPCRLRIPILPSPPRRRGTSRTFTTRATMCRAAGLTGFLGCK
ncbi:hypothetical protein DIPPA_62584 [Diplonema papillatum]|nr:hypothetical protein DIPPA_62584 [Diplonema papillatum]